MMNIDSQSLQLIICKKKTKKKRLNQAYKVLHSLLLLPNR